VHTFDLWNTGKVLRNLRKHGVDFADAVIALEDENALTIEERDHDEQRFRMLGMGPELNLYGFNSPLLAVKFYCAAFTLQIP